MVRSALAIAAVALAAASFSGDSIQSPEPIPTEIPEPFEAPRAGPFSLTGLDARATPLGEAAPPWAARLYERSLRVLVALTDPDTGAMIAGDREGWDYVWPRDAAAGAIALHAAGLEPEARRVVGFLSGLDLDDAARFYPDGAAVPGRTAAGDGEGWVAAADRIVTRPTFRTVLLKGRRATKSQDSPLNWRVRQDFGENVTGNLLGNAIAAGASAREIRSRFLTARGLVREEGGADLDSAAAWAATLFPIRGLRGAVKETLLQLARRSTPFGITPIEGWTLGEVWTAPTAWSAWALAELGEMKPADRLLRALRRAATPHATLPERVNAEDGNPTSTTPLAWSHAFAILALRTRYPAGERGGS